MAQKIDHLALEIEFDVTRIDSISIKREIKNLQGVLKVRERGYDPEET